MISPETEDYKFINDLLDFNSIGRFKIIPYYRQYTLLANQSVGVDAPSGNFFLLRQVVVYDVLPLVNAYLVDLTTFPELSKFTPYGGLVNMLRYSANNALFPTPLFLSTSYEFQPAIATAGSTVIYQGYQIQKL